MKNKNVNRCIILLVCTALFSCKKKSTGFEEAIPPVQVKAVAVARRDMSEYITFNGVTKYEKQEDIKANVTGYVSWMPYGRGDIIEKGQAFASIRTKEQDALKDAVSIDSSLAQFTSPLYINSNTTGIITSLNVIADDYVSEGEVLATISRPSTLEVLVSIPYEYAQKIVLGMPCEIFVQGLPVINASISSRLTSTDSIGQAQHFLVNLNNRSLPQNLNVQVHIISKHAQNALVIPKEALQTNELLTRFWVLKMVNDSLAIKKRVTPLLENDSLIQVASGELQVNDRVITEGGYQMQDSTRVRIIDK